MVAQNPTETDMEKFKEGTNRYAIKVQENRGYYLLANRYMNGEIIIEKYTLSKRQYDFIDKNMMYWFDIKYKKANDFTLGTVKKVYDFKPW